MSLSRVTIARLIKTGGVCAKKASESDLFSYSKMDPDAEKRIGMRLNKVFEKGIPGSSFDWRGLQTGGSFFEERESPPSPYSSLFVKEKLAKMEAEKKLVAEQQVELRSAAEEMPEKKLEEGDDEERARKRPRTNTESVEEGLAEGEKDKDSERVEGEGRSTDERESDESEEESDDSSSGSGASSEESAGERERAFRAKVKDNLRHQAMNEARKGLQ